MLLFAPPGDEGRDHMLRILRDHGIVGRWVLQPIRSKTHDLQSSQLSHILQEALRIQRRHTRQDGPVVFLGMDSPEVPLSELVAACFNTAPNEALLCPAADGGYGLLSVPASANPRACFANVQWSHPLTALSQIKALTDQGLTVSLGPIMHDIDDGDDMEQLCRRLRSGVATTDPTTSLSLPSLPSRMYAKRPPSVRGGSNGSATTPSKASPDSSCSPKACGVMDAAPWFPIPVTPSPRREQKQQCKYTRKTLIALEQLEEVVAVPKSSSMAEEDDDPGLKSSTFPSCGEGTTSTLLEDLKAVWSI